MASLDHAQLAAITSAVEDHTQRVADLAGHLDGSAAADAVGALYEAERSLRMAARALTRASKALPRDA